MSDADGPGFKFERAERALAVSSHRLRRLGLLALLATLLNLVSTVTGLSMRPFVYYDWIPLLVTLPALSGLSALTALVLFDVGKRRGEALYAEVSEEAQYRLSHAASDSPEEFRRPPFELRIAMRDFASATQLPLVPGRSGPAVLAAVNLVLMLLIPATLAF